MSLLSTIGLHLMLRCAGPGRSTAGLAALALLGASAAAVASPGIYICTDAQGRRHTADRPVTACLDREQRILNKDGTQRGLLPPRMSAQQRAEAAAAERAQELDRVAREQTQRRDRLLLARYPTPAAHEHAREGSLGPVRQSLEAARQRIQSLEQQQAARVTAAAPPPGAATQSAGRAAAAALEVALAAEQAKVLAQQSELNRLERQFDEQARRLQPLWQQAGQAPAGTGAGAAQAAERGERATQAATLGAPRLP